MKKSLFSANWYRVSELRPKVRAHARIHRFHFRGQLWYVLQDRTSGRFHRFTPSSYLVISLLDGERTVQDVWDLACERLGDDVLTQDDLIRLLAQLHAANVLRGDVPPDLGEVSARTRQINRRKLALSFINPMAIRLPLLDPDAFLEATFPVVRWLFSWVGALLFVLVVGYALVLAGMHWDELTENITDRVLATESLLLLLLTYPLVKVLHELGHGYAIKRWGGEVHEIGVMFLVFMPVPYVDASDATSFHEKWRRVLVSGAGILVELFLAALAMLVWVNADEGLVRAFAFNVMLIGGVSTVLFNGNPLLRFDGYYMFSDAIEIPNLAARANRYIGYLIQTYLFRLEGVDSPVTAPGEHRWLFCYSIASFLYRMFIVATIVLFVATKFFVVGVLMAFWALFLMLGLPLFKLLKYLLASPVLRHDRARALAVSFASVAALIVFLAAIPLPHATVTEGVLWTPNESVVHTNADGIVEEVLVAPNSVVAAGEALVRMVDPLLEAQVRLLEKRRAELSMRYTALDTEDPVEASIVSEQLKHAEADLNRARQRRDGLLVRSPNSGRFIVARADDLPGRYFRKGMVLGYVYRSDAQVVRVIVPEDDAELVRNRSRGVELRLAERMAEVMPSQIVRSVPALSDTLPSMALSTMGGGKIVMDPTDPSAMKALSNLLHLELKADVHLTDASLGERVYVRFTHGFEPVAVRLYRGVRQVFIRQFNV